MKVKVSVGSVKVSVHQTGINGCCAKTKRRGTLRFCAQHAIYSDASGEWCYYHRPGREKKFGEGY